MAQVIVSKGADHLPLYRLEGIFKRQGVRISRQTMDGWWLRTAEFLRPLYALAVQVVEKSADEVRIDLRQGQGVSGWARSLGEMAELVEVVGGSVPLLVGSGVSSENVSDLVPGVAGFIVGTSVKRQGDVTEPVDETRARALAAAVRELRSAMG